MNNYLENPKYTFRNGMYKGAPANIYRKGDVPKFKISEKLRKAVFEGIPKEISCEEQAIFVYYRLCELLEYDENYFYQKNLGFSYSQEFGESVVSKIEPGSKVICGDFSIIYYQFLSEIEGVEPVIIEQEDKTGSYHYLNGFYTDKLSISCEAINITQSETIGARGDIYTISANDIARIKCGIISNGFSGYDIYGKLPGIMKRMFIMATNRQPKTNYEDMFYDAQEQYYDILDQEEFYSINRLLYEYRKAPKTEIKKSVSVFEKKFKAFLRILQMCNITDNTAYIVFYNLDEIGFFGGKTFDTKVGEKEMKDGKVHYRRLVLFQRDDTSNIYCFDPRELTMEKIKREEIEKNIASGDWMYEREEEKLLE